MSADDYPALCKAAEKAAAEAQTSVLRAYWLYTSLLVGGAAVAPFAAQNRWMAGLSLALFLGSIAAYAFRSQRRLHDKWYRSRALAESIKTVTWRYVMHAEPFSSLSAAENADEFRSRLAELLRENRGVASQLDVHADGMRQVTDGMSVRLGWGLEDALAGYLQERIQDQLKWYRDKHLANRSSSRVSFALVVASYAAAVLMLIGNIIAPGAIHMPVGAVAVIASGLIGWAGLRRFDELASAYALTAHEVSIIESRASAISSAEELARFVGDSENAFSREHTQWAARRDT